MPETTLSSRFVVCIDNDGYAASLERRKIYRCVVDADAEIDGDLRIVDESGEDYIYPACLFMPVELPPAVEEALHAAE